MPKTNEIEKTKRKQAIQDATKYAIEIPFTVMQTAHQSLSLIQQMAETGNPNSVSDAGVGALCARTAVYGAYLNVKINAAGYDDKSYVEDILTKANLVLEKTVQQEQQILEIVNSKIS